jgi:hypothetical protein
MPPMKLKNHKALSFSLKLGAELERQNVSIRELSRRLNPDDPGTARRNIHRWLSPVGHTKPSRASRRNVAVALGLDPDYFDAEDEGDCDLLGSLQALLDPRFPTFIREEFSRWEDKKKVGA